MQTKNQKAFTLTELIFVIIILGILSAIAVPKFQNTAEEAYISKAKSDIVSARSALAMLRQKNILQGKTANITPAEIGNNFSKLLSFPVKSCTSSGCNGWSTSADGKSFTFHGPSNDVVFALQPTNILKCTSSATICKVYE